ncbi:MAG: bacteriohemerythrin [Rhodocyclaceae bacterium]|jgi:hemerythrin-like metal-binding protein|nr:bacteriohemerythrin [Rhodocyclaceae bacterium]
MEWKSEYSVGIALIDRQHQEILNYINQLTASLNARDRWTVTHHLLTQIEDFMRTHFAVEEALLEIVGYPAEEAHVASHGKMKAHMAELERRSIKEDITEELIAYLCQWFIQHVLHDDMDYGRYVSKHFRQVGGLREP